MITWMTETARELRPQTTKGRAGNQSTFYEAYGELIKCYRGPAEGNIIRELDGSAYNPSEVIATKADIQIRSKLFFQSDNTYLLIVSKKTIKRGNMFSHYELEGVRVDR